MKKKAVLAWLLAAIMVLTMAVSPWTAAPAKAASNRVVTIGADLSAAQREGIFQFFGTTPDAQTVLIITNADERAHLGHLIPSEVIGWQTFSCAYVAPTEANGIQVKTANMNYVTGNMIASTLATSGVVNCDVLAAAPFAVSGTGALTGVMMAYEQAIGEELDPEKKELANEELVTTGELAQEIGQDEAILVVNDIKIRIIRDGASPEDVEMIVNDVVNSVSNASVSSGVRKVALSQRSMQLLYEFSKKIAEMGYKYEDMQYTLQRVAQNVTESTGINDPIMDTFEERISTKISEDSILYTADDAAVGGNTSATFEDPSTTEEVTFDGQLSADHVSLQPYGTVDANSWVDGTNVLYYRGSNGAGLMDVDGHMLTDTVYSGLYGEFGYITGEIPNGTINCDGLLNVSGEELISFRYGRVDLSNSHWAVCWELTDSTEDDADAHDYDDNYYKISSADIYYLEDDQARLAATLTRDQMGEYYTNGKTINIQNRATGEVNCYNEFFEVIQSGLNSVYSSIDSNLLGEIHTYRANGQEGLMDGDGNVIMSPSYYSVYADTEKDYIRVSTGSKEGLIDWDGNEMIPAEYDAIKYNYYVPMTKRVRMASGFAGNGYVTALLNGTYVFLDVNGNVTNASSVQEQGYDDEIAGASVRYLDSSEHPHILSADGVDTDLGQYSRVMPLAYASGMLYRVQSEDYRYGLVDWHGNVIFEPKFDRISLSADGKWLLVNEYYAGTTLFQVSYDGPEYVPVVREKADTRKEVEIRDQELMGDQIGVSLYNTINAEVRWTDSGNELHYGGDSVLLDVDENELTEDVYTNFYGYLSTYYRVELKNGSNSKFGLLNTEGDVLIPADFDNITFCGNHWALAFVLEETDKDEGDFRNYSTDTYSDIVTAEIYYLEDGTANHVATLGYDEIADYHESGNGEYLNIQDRAGNAVAYDKNFQVYEEGLYSAYSSISGNVYDYQTFRDNGQYGLMDGDGNILLPAAYSYIYIDEAGGYATLEYDEKKGAADLEGHILVPTEYDRVLNSYYSPLVKGQRNSGIIANGYIAVQANDAIGFFDINGNLTVEPSINKDDADVNGASLTYTGADGNTHILAGDGVDTVVDGDKYQSIYVLNYSGGMLYRVTDENYDYGVIDWHGNLVLPCGYNSISLSANGKYLLATPDYREYQIYSVFYNGEGGDAAPQVNVEEETEEETEEVTEDPAETKTGKLTKKEEPQSEPEEESPAEETQPEETVPAEPSQDSADADPRILVLEGIKALAAEDYEGNKENIVLLLTQTAPFLEADYPQVAELLNSTVKLINNNMADANTLGILLDTAAAELAK